MEEGREPARLSLPEGALSQKTGGEMFPACQGPTTSEGEKTRKAKKRRLGGPMAANIRRSKDGRDTEP